MASPQSRNEEDCKKCWICISDETEDTPDTAPWRDPCPCALVAHEDCLLDWIADVEAPRNRAGRGIGPPKIECPQCKADIRLSRPRDYLVDAVNTLQRLGDTAVIPVSVFALAGAMQHLSAVFGTHAIYAVFGAEDSYRILQPLFDMTERVPLEVSARDPGQVMELMSNFVLERARNWRLLFGLPLIAPVLILSRTSLADSVLPVLPMVFCASQAQFSGAPLDFATWPPSAGFAFASLPYVRSLYKACYKTVWAKKEEQWREAIKPRVSQQNEEDAAANNGQNPAEVALEGENIFEIRIDHNVWDEGDWDEEEERLVQQAADRQPAAVPHDMIAGGQDQGGIGGHAQAERPLRNLPPEGGFPRADEAAAAAPAPVIRDGRILNGAEQEQQDAPAPAPAPDQPNNGNGRRLSLSVNHALQSVVGALFFPTIAGLAGEALKLVLPYTWVAEPPPSLLFWNRRPKGFLQNKWARSLVGGCLVVVCKDALLLYVKWRMAQMHKSRRVLDFDRSKGRGPLRSSSPSSG